MINSNTNVCLVVLVHDASEALCQCDSLMGFFLVLEEYFVLFFRDSFETLLRNRVLRHVLDVELSFSDGCECRMRDVGGHVLAVVLGFSDGCDGRRHISYFLFTIDNRTFSFVIFDESLDVVVIYSLRD